jgi:Tol biopolymer transport system component
VSFDGVSPSDLIAGSPRRIARGLPCRPPLFLADGRLAVGSTVVDPVTNVTVEFDVAAQELAWSPIGDKVAILTTDRKEIRLAAPDGSGAVTRVREARGLLSSLSWSPDGARLAYIAEPDPATRQLTGDPTSQVVMILNATNGSKASAGPGASVAWSPDPDVLAVEMSGGVIQSSSPSGQRSELTTGRRPAWSADGRFLSVVRTEGEQQRGWIVPSSGQGGIAITGGGVCALSFSPTGRALAVVGNKDGKTTLQLRTLEIEGRPSEG